MEKQKTKYQCELIQLKLNIEQAVKDKERELIKTYSFVANPNLTIRQNIKAQLLQHSINNNIRMVTNTSFHNLSPHKKTPPCIASLLGLGHKFCIQRRTPKPNLRQSFIKFTRSIRLRAYIIDTAPIQDDSYNPRLYEKSKMKPPIATTQTESSLNNFMCKMISATRNLPTSPRYNLTKLQRNILRQLRDNQQNMVLNTDKNLGMALIDRDDYIKAILTEHLTKTEIYRNLTPQEAHSFMLIAETEIQTAVRENLHNLMDPDIRFFNRSFKKEHRFPVFYGTPKIHKRKNKLGYYPMRPVVSKCGSFIEIASRFCDHYLTKLLPFVPTYLKDSYTLLYELNNLQLPPQHNFKLLTSDAIGMYTNIDTNHGLASVEDFLYENLNNLPEDYPHELIVRLLKIVMKYNIFQFGDLFFLQLQGTAMGTSVACKYATLYLAGNEKNNIIPKYNHQLVYFKRYIDDVIAIWNPQGPYTWEDFHNDLFFGKLEWETENPSKQTNFLDLTIKFDKNGKLFTKTFEKQNNLHLYVPANSAHPTGTLKSLVMGMIRRYWLQNTNKTDFIKQIKMFTQRLRKRGYNLEVIKNHILRASQHLQTKMGNKRTFISKTKNAAKNENTNIFYHRVYHPRDIKNYSIQRIYKNCFKNLPKFNGLTICNSRPKNLQDLLIPSKLPDVPLNNPSDILRTLQF